MQELTPLKEGKYDMKISHVRFSTYYRSSNSFISHSNMSERNLFHPIMWLLSPSSLPPG